MRLVILLPSRIISDPAMIKAGHAPVLGQKVCKTTAHIQAVVWQSERQWPVYT